MRYLDFRLFLQDFPNYYFEEKGLLNKKIGKQEILIGEPASRMN